MGCIVISRIEFQLKYGIAIQCPAGVGVPLWTTSTLYVLFGHLHYLVIGLGLHNRIVERIKQGSANEEVKVEVEALQEVA